MRRALASVILLLSCVSPSWGTSREVLPNGLRVLLVPSASTEVMAATMLLAIPVSADPPDKLGLRYLTHRLLLRGTTRETGEAMGERLAAVGGTVSVNCALDYLEITVRAPSDGLEVALDLLAQAVQSPAFLPEEVEREKTRAIAAARAARDDPFQCTYQALREELYGKEAYGRWALGEPECLRRLTREDVAAFYRRHYRPEAAVLAIAGGIEAVSAGGAVRLRFGAWRGPAERRATPARATGEPLASSQITARERPTARLHLMLGFPAPAVATQGYYAMQVIDSLLGGGSTARLPKALREQAGLAYEVSSFYPTLAGDSHFAIYAVVDEDALREAKQAILAQLTRLREEPVSAEELAHAKRYLLGVYALSRQESRRQAYSAAWHELLGCPPDFAALYQEKLNAVTAEEVQDTARTLIHHFILALTAPSV